MDGPSPLDAQLRENAVRCLEDQDWYGAYVSGKAWINQGGAGLLDPWLVYVASALLHGQPRTAVHSTDLALRGWFDEPADRAILSFVRARVVRHRLRDPKTAAPDIAAAVRDAPRWLVAVANVDLEEIAEEASRSRKRKASVSPAPGFRGIDECNHDLGDRRLPAGTQPALWLHLDRFLGPAPPAPAIP